MINLIRIHNLNMYRDWLSYSQDHQRQRPGNSRSQEAAGKCRPNSGCPAIVCWSDDKDQLYGLFTGIHGISMGIHGNCIGCLTCTETWLGNGQLNGKNTHKWGKKNMAIFHCRRVNWKHSSWSYSICSIRDFLVWSPLLVRLWIHATMSSSQYSWCIFAICWRWCAWNIGTPQMGEGCPN